MLDLEFVLIAISLKLLEQSCTLQYGMMWNPLDQAQDLRSVCLSYRSSFLPINDGLL